MTISPDPRLRSPDEAVKHSEEAVTLKPRNADFRNTLALARYRDGDLGGAIEALEHNMRSREGGIVDDWLVMAMVQSRLGHTEDAREWYEKAIAWFEADHVHGRRLALMRAEAEAVLVEGEK